MPANGSGIWERTPGTRIANQGALDSAQVNDETDNLIDGVNYKVSLTGVLPMTGVQTIVAGTAAAHAAAVSQVQSGILQSAASVGGTVDAITITMSPASTAWTNKQRFTWISVGANTITNPTINKDGLGAKTVKSRTGAALAVGDLGISGTVNEGYYNGTDVLFLGGTTGAALLASANDFTQINTFTNTGLHLLDTNASHDLILKPGSDLTADRILTLTTGDAARTVSITADTTLSGGTHSGTNTGDQGITLATEQASTSGTAVTFSGIPAGTKRITIMLNGVSTNGTSNLGIEIGDSGGFENTGYDSIASESSISQVTSTALFLITQALVAAEAASGKITLDLMNAATFFWVSTGSIKRNATIQPHSTGTKALSSELTQLRLRAVNGTDTFDAGTVNISYES